MNRQPIQPDQQANYQQISPHNSSLQVNQMDWIIKPYIDSETKISKGGLAISNIQFCQNRQKMQRQSFKAVLSVCGDKLIIPVVVEHLWIIVDDHPRENISSFFTNSYSFIERNRQVGNVLVHCRAGISRSCSINNINFDKAFELVRTQRPIAYPNKGFTKQLKRYANQVLKQQRQDNKGKECLIF